MEMEYSLLLPKPTKGGGIKRYSRRRHFEGGATTKKTKIVRLRRSPQQVRGERKNNSYWRIRAIPRLRWVIKSPMKMLINLKNAYINFMLKVSMNNTDHQILGGKRSPKAPQVSKNYSSDAIFEARLIYEISKALVASHELFPM